MFESDQYQLLDFGDGTKIERFGNCLIAPESPSVEMFEPKVALSEHEVDASYDSRLDERCSWHGDIEDQWNIKHDQSTFLLKQTCLLYTSPSPRDQRGSRMPSSA